MSSNVESKTTKPQNEVVVQFTKDADGNIIISFIDIHGTEMKAEARKAGLPMKAFGEQAAKLTSKIGEFTKALGLQRHGFTTRTGKRYYSYHALPSA